jgi:predicted O-methyltransferase YrrM
MDIERFAAELPQLFDDFPRSAQPRGRRFDDVIAGVPNLAEENVLALLNLAASLLGPGESYVEVGTLFGASLIGASRGNTGDFVAIDNFGFPGTSTRGRNEPPADRAALEENLRRFGADGATIIEGDAFELLERGALGDRKVGVYYYDGPHDEGSQERGLRLVEPWLADEALLVVDDHDWEAVERGTAAYVASQPNAEVLLVIPGAGKGSPQWWEGVAVLSWRRGRAPRSSTR